MAGRPRTRRKKASNGRKISTRKVAIRKRSKRRIGGGNAGRSPALRGKMHSGTFNAINVGMMTDDAFKVKFPDAWKLFQYFDSKMEANKPKRIHAGINRKKSRLFAWKLTSMDEFTKHINAEEITDCINWVFSKGRKSLQFWGSIEVNHLETAFKMVNIYREKTHTGGRRKGTFADYAKN